VPPKVALINVGFEAGEHVVQRSPPFGIMCVGAFLRENSIQTRLFDWSGQMLGEERKNELRDFGPDIVGFTVLVSSSIVRASTVSNWAREMGGTGHDDAHGDGAERSAGRHRDHRRGGADDARSLHRPQEQVRS